MYKIAIQIGKTSRTTPRDPKGYTAPLNILAIGPHISGSHVDRRHRSASSNPPTTTPAPLYQLHRLLCLGSCTILLTVLAHCFATAWKRLCEHAKYPRDTSQRPLFAGRLSHYPAIYRWTFTICYAECADEDTAYAWTPKPWLPKLDSYATAAEWTGTDINRDTWTNGRERRRSAR